MSHCRRQSSELLLITSRSEIMRILHILQDSTATWNREAPAKPKSLRKLVTEAWVELPEEYLALLGYSNGGEGQLGIEPGWFQLWPAEDVIDLNKACNIEEYLPGFFGFGSNGGGEMLAFDTRSVKPWKIAMIPFIPMEIEDVIIIADSIEKFLQAMGHDERV